MGAYRARLRKGSCTPTHGCMHVNAWVSVCALMHWYIMYVHACVQVRECTGSLTYVHVWMHENGGLHVREHMGVCLCLCVCMCVNAFLQ